jgi:hypothetical protein
LLNLFHQSARITQQTTATNENKRDYKEINMHSNKMVFAFVLATMMTSAWAESAPTPAATLAEEKTVSQGNATTPSETQTEVRVEDIDAPILE